MRHRAPYHGGDALVLFAQLRNQLRHEPGNLDGVRPLVHDRPRPLVANVDGARPPAARQLAQVVLHHHVVQAPDQRRVVLEVRIVRQLQDERHGVAVSPDGRPYTFGGVQRVAAAHGRHGVVQRDVQPFDAVGRLNCAGGRDTPQQPGPAPLLGDLAAQRVAQLVHACADVRFLLVERRRVEKHVE